MRNLIGVVIYMVAMQLLSVAVNLITNEETLKDIYAQLKSATLSQTYPK